MNKSRAFIEFVEFYMGPALIQLVCIKLQGVPKKVGIRSLNRFDSYCSKEHLDGSKGGQQSPVLRTGGAVKWPPMDGLTSNSAWKVVLGGRS